MNLLTRARIGICVSHRFSRKENTKRWHSKAAARHCEQSEAIQSDRRRTECFVAMLLAMTAVRAVLSEQSRLGRRRRHLVGRRRHVHRLEIRRTDDLQIFHVRRVIEQVHDAGPLMHHVAGLHQRRLLVYELCSPLGHDDDLEVAIVPIPADALRRLHVGLHQMAGILKRRECADIAVHLVQGARDARPSNVVSCMRAPTMAQRKDSCARPLPNIHLELFPPAPAVQL